LARLPVGVTYRSGVPPAMGLVIRLRRKLAGSISDCHNSSYTLCSSDRAKVSPTNAVAKSVCSSCSAARSMASERMRRWSNASVRSSIASATGHSRAAAASVPACRAPGSGITAR
jgi:hypothetical protein